ncbi:UDP-N-acetylmuramate dehydrogenase [Acidiferrimicrobium sp. IK]|uniref:UDP-N-acetylmuramate dehydrogenase n=1 Tax=Acidiferrimicrobium sp. IK TaxID=2871700 RepID=UPI0021CB4A21|nr:UDP-N-acetylmuramate dehydrogenase [Acidiferrimicrobium sp. IK]MCU4183684.1 UDP-N-acetylmuramate dehydrogenase [Acidiferrimicrobium sp. IK]
MTDSRGLGSGSPPGPEPTPDPRRIEEASEILGPLAQIGAPLGTRTTYRVGGPAAVLVVASSLEDLGAVARAHRATGLEVLAVGRGSNLLVADRGYPGIAVILDPAETAFGAVHFEGSQVRCGAAVPLPTLARRSVDAGLTGFEWAVGVPGSAGGAARMNAGGHGSDMARSVAAVTVADMACAPDRDGRAVLQRIELAELGYGYRRSSLRATQIVVEIELALSKGDAAAGGETIRAIVRWRREHQPGGQNAGSVFTNPPGPGPARSAGWLVEAAGLKGARHGSAEVSAKHANFIQADPGGSADDVNALIEEVRRSVASAFGVTLTTEIRRIGFEASSTADPVTPADLESQRLQEG